MDFQEWLKQWLARHPAKDSSPGDRAAYTAEVMRRVREQEAPANALAPAWSWWRPTLALAATAAVVFLVVSRVQQPPQVAEEISSEAQSVQISQAPQPAPLLDTDPGFPAQPMLLAEDSFEDEAWLAETLRLLEALDEDLPADSSDGWSDEEWMDEIEMLESDPFSS